MSGARQAAPQFSVNRAAFARELEFISQAGETKTTIPILATVKLDAGEGVLRLTATNLDVTAQSQVLTNGPASGAICVDLKRLLVLTKNMADGEVLLGIERDKLQIQSGRSKFNLSGWDVDKFPNVETVDGQVVTLPTQALAAMLAATPRAVDDEESKYGNTKALELRIESGRALMTACNGYLGLRAEVETDTEGTIIAALSRPFFRALAGLFAGADGTTSCIVSEKAIKFQDASRAVSGKLLAGRLPDFDSLFNRPRESVGQFKRADFQQALRRLFAVFDDTDKTLKPVSLALTDKWIDLSAEAKDVGNGSDGFEVNALVPAFTRRSNAVTLRVALDVCESEHLIMALAGGQIRFDAEWEVGSSLTLRFTALCATLA